jgi:hypothetical protein
MLWQRDPKSGHHGETVVGTGTPCDRMIPLGEAVQ